MKREANIVFYKEKLYKYLSNDRVRMGNFLEKSEKKTENWFWSMCHNGRLIKFNTLIY